MIPLDNNYLTQLTTAENLQIEGFHEISHKIDLVNQTVITIKIVITIQDQTQTELTTPVIIRNRS